MQKLIRLTISISIIILLCGNIIANDNEPPSFSGLSSITDLQTSGRVKLFWSAASDASPPIKYFIYRSTDMNVLSDTSEFVAQTQNLYYEDSNLTDNLTYYYIVRAVDNALPSQNEDTNSETMGIIPTDQTPPTFDGITSISDLEDTVSPLSIYLSWSSASDLSGDTITYKIYISTTTVAGPFKNIAETTAISYILEDTDLIENVTHYVYVRAFDQASTPNGSDTPSNISGIIPDNTPPVFTGADTVIDTNRGGEIQIKWSPASDSSGPVTYKIYISTSQNIIPETYNINPNYVVTNDTIYTVQGLLDEITYYVLVRAYDNSVDSKHDYNENTIAIVTSDTNPPTWDDGDGLDNAFSTGNGKEIYLSWGTATDLNLPIKYYVYLSTSSGVFDDLIDTYNTENTNYQINNLINDLTYYVAVRAMDSSRTANIDTNTDTIAVIPSDTNVPDFNGIDNIVNLSDGSGIKITWTEVSEPAGDSIYYLIYRSTESWAMNDSQPYDSQIIDTVFAMDYYTDTGVDVSILPDSIVYYYYIVRAKDSSNNRDSNIKELGSYSTDEIPPLTSISAGPANNSIVYSNEVRFILSGSDNIDAETELLFAYRKLGSDWSSYFDTTYLQLDLAAGTYIIYFRCKDLSGNVDTSNLMRTFYIDISVEDNVNPTVSLVRGPLIIGERLGAVEENENKVNDERGVGFQYDDINTLYTNEPNEDDGVDTTYAFQNKPLDVDVYTNITRPVITLADMTMVETTSISVENTEYMLVFETGTIIFGGVGPAGKPEVTYTADWSYPINNSTLSFEWIGSDNLTDTSNMRYVYRIDSPDKSTEWSSPSLSKMVSFSNLADGTHELFVSSVDEADNYSEPLSVSFTIRERPEVILTSFPLSIESATLDLDTDTPSAIIWFEWTGEDNSTSSSDLKYDYYLEGYDGTAFTGVWKSNDMHTYLSVPAGNSYKFHIVAKDQNGNISDELEYSFKVNAPPNTLMVDAQYERFGTWDAGYFESDNQWWDDADIRPIDSTGDTKVNATPIKSKSIPSVRNPQNGDIIHNTAVAFTIEGRDIEDGELIGSYPDYTSIPRYFYDKLEFSWKVDDDLNDGNSNSWDNNNYKTSDQSASLSLGEAFRPTETCIEIVDTVVFKHDGSNNDPNNSKNTPTLSHREDFTVIDFGADRATSGDFYVYPDNALPDGWHTFKVRARDSNGARDPSPLKIRFLVAEYPTVKIMSSPEGEITEDEATFTWQGIDNTTPAAQLLYSYKLNGPGSVEGIWSDWVDSTSYTVTNLQEGYYTFIVRVRDMGYNGQYDFSENTDDNIRPEPEEIQIKSFNVALPPETIISKGPWISDEIAQKGAFTRSIDEPDSDPTTFAFNHLPANYKFMSILPTGLIDGSNKTYTIEEYSPLHIVNIIVDNSVLSPDEYLVTNNNRHIELDNAPQSMIKVTFTQQADDEIVLKMGTLQTGSGFEAVTSEAYLNNDSSKYYIDYFDGSIEFGADPGTLGDNDILYLSYSVNILEDTVRVKNVGFEFSASDAVTPLDEIKYSYEIDYNGPTSYNLSSNVNITNLSDGQHRISVTAKDGSNLEDITPVEIYYYIQTEPVVEIDIGPEQGELYQQGISSTVYKADIYFSWSGSDLNGSISEYHYKLDTDDWVSVGTDTSISLNISEAGAHIFSIRAKDNDNLYSSVKKAYFIVSQTPQTYIVTDTGYLTDNYVESQPVYDTSILFTWYGEDAQTDTIFLNYKFSLKIDNDLLKSNVDTTELNYFYVINRSGTGYFEVKTVDESQNEDVISAVYQFYVPPVPPKFDYIELYNEADGQIENYEMVFSKYLKLKYSATDTTPSDQDLEYSIQVNDNNDSVIGKATEIILTDELVVGKNTIYLKATDYHQDSVSEKIIVYYKFQGLQFKRGPAIVGQYAENYKAEDYMEGFLAPKPGDGVSYNVFINQNFNNAHLSDFVAIFNDSNIIPSYNITHTEANEFTVDEKYKWLRRIDGAVYMQIKYNIESDTMFNLHQRIYYIDNDSETEIPERDIPVIISNDLTNTDGGLVYDESLREENSYYIDYDNGIIYFRDPQFGRPQITYTMDYKNDIYRYDNVLFEWEYNINTDEQYYYRYAFDLADNADSTWSNWSEQTQLKIENLYDDTYIIMVEAKDETGTIIDSTSLQFVVGVPPQVWLVSAPTNPYNSNTTYDTATVQFSWDASDNLTPKHELQYRVMVWDISDLQRSTKVYNTVTGNRTINITLPGDAEYITQVNAIDAVGMYSDTAEYRFFINLPPQIRLLELEDVTVGDTGSPTDKLVYFGIVNENLYINPPNGEEINKTNVVYFMHGEERSEYLTSQYYYFSWKITPPDSANDGNESSWRDWQLQESNANVNAVEAITGHNDITDPAALDDGLHIFKARIKDLSGAISPVIVQRSFVVKYPPIVTITTYPSSVINDQSATFEWDVKDNTAASTEIYVSYKLITPSNADGTFSDWDTDLHSKTFTENELTQEGLYTFIIRARDVGGDGIPLNSDDNITEMNYSKSFYLQLPSQTIIVRGPYMENEEILGLGNSTETAEEDDNDSTTFAFFSLPNKYFTVIEEPSGIIDGTNQTFTLDNTPEKIVEVIVDDVVIDASNYTLNDNIITFKVFPQNYIQVHYIFESSYPELPASLNLPILKVNDEICTAVESSSIKWLDGNNDTMEYNIDYLTGKVIFGGPPAATPYASYSINWYSADFNAEIPDEKYMMKQNRVKIRVGGRNGENYQYSYRLDDNSYSMYDAVDEIIYVNLEDGWHTIYVKTKGSVGEEDITPVKITFYVRTTPILSIDTGPRPWIQYSSTYTEKQLSDSVYFAWSGIDLNGTVTGYLWSMDNSETYTLTPDTSMFFYISDTSTENHKLHFIAVDNDSKYSEIKTISYYINLSPQTYFVYDTQTDTAISVADYESQTIAFEWIGVDAHTPQSQLLYRYWYSDAVEPTTWSSDTTFTDTITSHTTKTLKVRTKDSDGNEDATPAEFTFTPIYDPPTFTKFNVYDILGDTVVNNGYITSDTVNIDFEAFDTNPISGIIAYSYKIDTGNWNLLGADSAVEISGLATGQHGITIRAVDAFGDYNDTDITFTYIAIPPEFTSFGVTDVRGDTVYDNDKILSDTVLVYFSATDTSPLGGAITYNYQINDDTLTLINSSSTVEITGLQFGDNTIRIYAIDQYGDSSYQERKVEVQNVLGLFFLRGPAVLGEQVTPKELTQSVTIDWVDTYSKEAEFQISIPLVIEDIIGVYDVSGIINPSDYDIEGNNTVIMYPTSRYTPVDFVTVQYYTLSQTTYSMLHSALDWSGDTDKRRLEPVVHVSGLSSDVEGELTGYDSLSDLIGRDERSFYLDTGAGELTFAKNIGTDIPIVDYTIDYDSVLRINRALFQWEMNDITDTGDFSYSYGYQKPGQTAIENWTLFNNLQSVYISDLEDGDYTFSVRAKNLNGTIVDTETVTFTVGVPPELELLSAPPHPYNIINDASTVACYFEWQGNDNSSASVDIDYRYSVKDLLTGEITTYNSNNWVSSNNATINLEGNNYYEFRLEARDSNGNISIKKLTHRFLINLPPNTIIIPPPARWRNMDLPVPDPYWTLFRLQQPKFVKGYTEKTANHPKTTTLNPGNGSIIKTTHVNFILEGIETRVTNKYQYKISPPASTDDGDISTWTSWDRYSWSYTYKSADFNGKTITVFHSYYPVNYGNVNIDAADALDDGYHIFKARVLDKEGAIDPTPLERTFYVKVPPEIEIIQQPATQISKRNITLEWKGKDNTTAPEDILFSYKLDKPDESGVYTDWINTTKVEFDAQDIYTEGIHQFYIRARDLGSNGLKDSDDNISEEPTVVSFNVKFDPQTLVAAGPYIENEELGVGNSTYTALIDDNSSTTWSFVNLPVRGFSMSEDGIGAIDGTNTEYEVTYSIEKISSVIIDYNNFYFQNDITKKTSNSINVPVAPTSSIVINYISNQEGVLSDDSLMYPRIYVGDTLATDVTGDSAAQTNNMNYEYKYVSDNMYTTGTITFLSAPSITPKASYTAMYVFESQADYDSSTPANMIKNNNVSFIVEGKKGGVSPNNMNYKFFLDDVFFSEVPDPVRRTEFTGLSEGAHTIKVVAYDEEENVDKTPAEIMFYVKTAPDIYIDTGPIHNVSYNIENNIKIYSDTAYFSWYAIDYNGTIAYFEYYIDDPSNRYILNTNAETSTERTFYGETTIYLTNFSAYSNPHYILIYAVDNEGNKSEGVKGYIDISQSPQTYITYNGVNVTNVSVASYDSLTITYNWTSIDFTSDSTQMEYRYWYSTEVEPSTWVTNTTFTDTITNSGTNVFYVRAKDSDGNEDPTPAWIEFNVYSAAPLFTIFDVYDINGDTVGLNETITSDSVYIEFQATDTTPVNTDITYQYYIDTETPINLSTNTSALVTGISRGVHKLTVRAEDYFGDYSETYLIFEHKAIPPVFDTFSITDVRGSNVRDGDKILSDTVLVQFHAIDTSPLGGSIKYYYQIDNNTIFPVEDNGETTISGFPYGTHYFKFYAVDAYGDSQVKTTQIEIQNILGLFFLRGPAVSGEQARPEKLKRTTGQWPVDFSNVNVKVEFDLYPNIGDLLQAYLASDSIAESSELASQIMETEPEVASEIIGVYDANGIISSSNYEVQGGQSIVIDPDIYKPEEFIEVKYYIESETTYMLLHSLLDDDTNDTRYKRTAPLVHVGDKTSRYGDDLVRVNNFSALAGKDKNHFYLDNSTGQLIFADKIGTKLPIVDYSIDYDSPVRVNRVLFQWVMNDITDLRDYKYSYGYIEPGQTEVTNWTAYVSLDNVFLSELNDGNYTFFVRAKNADNVVRDTISLNFNVGIPPELELLSAPPDPFNVVDNASTVTVNFNWIAKDNSSAEFDIEYKYQIISLDNDAAIYDKTDKWYKNVTSASFELAGDNNYKFKLWGRDKSGNEVLDPIRYTFFINLPPSIQIIPLQDRMINGDLPLRDQDQSINRGIIIQPKYWTGTDGKTTVINPANGEIIKTTHVNFIVQGLEKSSSNKYSYKVVPPDSPDDGDESSWSSWSKYRWTYTYKDKEHEGKSISFNEDYYCAKIGATSITGAGALGDGYHLFKVRTQDKQGAVQPKPLESVFYVKVPPEIEVVKQPAAQTSNREISFEWTAKDNTTSSEKILFSYKLDKPDNPGVFSEFIDRTSITYSYNDIDKEGLYQFYIRARDLGANGIKDKDDNITDESVIITFKVQFAPETLISQGPYIEKEYLGPGNSTATALEADYIGTDTLDSTTWSFISNPLFGFILTEPGQGNINGDNTEFDVSYSISKIISVTVDYNTFYYEDDITISSSKTFEVPAAPSKSIVINYVSTDDNIISDDSLKRPIIYVGDSEAIDATSNINQWQNPDYPETTYRYWRGRIEFKENPPLPPKASYSGLFSLSDVSKYDTIPINTIKNNIVSFIVEGKKGSVSPNDLTYKMYLDDVPLGQTPDASRRVTLSDLTDGLHTFKAVAYDDAGNIDKSPAEVMFYIKTAPDVYIDSGPIQGRTYNSEEIMKLNSDTAYFSWHGIDYNGNVAYFEYVIDDPDKKYIILPDTNTSGSPKYTADTTFQLKYLVDYNNPHEIIVYAIDNDGNRSEAAKAYFDIAEEPQTFIVWDTTLYQNYIYYLEDTNIITINYTGQDIITNTDDLTYNITLQYREEKAIKQADQISTTTFTFVDLKGGKNIIRITAKDNDDRAPDKIGYDDPTPSELTVYVPNLSPFVRKLNLINIIDNDTYYFTSSKDTYQSDILYFNTNDIMFDFSGYDTITLANNLKYKYYLYPYENISEETTVTQVRYTGLPDSYCIYDTEYQKINPFIFNLEISDIEGNVNYSTFPFVIDMSPPDVEFTKYPLEVVFTPSAQFAWSGNDTITPIDKLQYEYNISSISNVFNDTWINVANINDTTIQHLPNGKRTIYIRAIDKAGNIDPTPASVEFQVITELKFEEPPHNYPNPAVNGSTKIVFNLNSGAQILIKIYNLLGELLYVSEPIDSFIDNEYTWYLQNDAGRKVGSGIYIYKVEAANGERTIFKTGKMVIIK